MEKSVNILHFLGGCTIDTVGRGAIAQTKMSISQRAPVEGVLCDAVCAGRFYDFLEKRKGKWAIVLRRLFHEKDRIDPVDLSQSIKLDPAVLKRYPVGYQQPKAQVSGRWPNRWMCVMPSRGPRMEDLSLPAWMRDRAAEYTEFPRMAALPSAW